MSPQLISIYALVAMFVVATILPINMGVLAFVGAFLVGTLVAGQTTSAIIAGFPGGLFLTLVGITFLFAIAQNNGTIDWLVRLAVKAVRGDRKRHLGHTGRNRPGCCPARVFPAPWGSQARRQYRPGWVRAMGLERRV